MAPLSLKVVQDNGAVTRTVKVESKASVEDALHTVLEKFMIPDDGKAYGLFLTSADNDRSGVWLESFRNVEYYMLRDGDTLLLLCKNRNLRLRMLDGSVKTLQVDESQPIAQMMIGICARIGITNHDEYGLCYENNEEDAESKVTSTGTLTLKRAPNPREKDAKLEHMSKKLKTDDNVQWLDMHRTLREMEVAPGDTLLLKRRLFYTDRNVDARDPVQLNLLYVQTRDAILCGRHPVTVDQGNCTIHDRLYSCMPYWSNRASDCVTRPSNADAIRDRGVAASCPRGSGVAQSTRNVSDTMPLPFNKALDVKLLRLVKENPILYNVKHPKYMDFDSREVVWQKIGDELGRPGLMCKSRWINMRDMMRKKVKERAQNPQNLRRHHYKYEEELSFMVPFFKDITPTTGEEYTEYLEEESDLVPNEVFVESYEEDNKEKIVNIRTKPEASTSYTNNSYEMLCQDLNPTDPIDVFLITIGTTLRKFSPYYLNQAKSKIFQVVQDYELQQIVDKDERPGTSDANR